MPQELSDARKLLDAKTSIPGELRTAEWRMLSQWLRERAFYMAGVAQAEILDEYRAEVQKIAQGDSSVEESRKRLEMFLTKVGYAPAPGQEGTIKDLRSVRRMQVSLRTNVDLLRGWGQKERGMRRGALTAFPAWELVRVAPRTVPRNWQLRWTRAGGPSNPDGRMIAMKDSDVWLELGSTEDGLGVDYPPFAWGSGMGWRPVGFREAKALGVIPAGWTPPPVPPVSSPNATLQTTPKISDRALRDELAARLKGLAEWRGDVLVFTDPNGSRPMSGEKLVEVWSRGMPPAFESFPNKGLMQQLALQRWSENHGDFTRELDPKTGMDIKPAPGRLDLFDDLLRLFKRLIPMPSHKPVFRGMAWKDEADFRRFLEDNRKTYIPQANKAADSWSVAESGARKYRRSGPFSVMLVCEKHSAAKDISALIRSIKDKIRNPDPKHPLVTDGEVVFANGAKFKVLRIERGTINQKGGEATVYVEQL